MENSLTNEQIARVFATYMPCNALWTDPQKDSIDTRLNGVVKDVWKSLWMGKTMWNGIECIEPIQNFKLLLTPLSAISDEDAIEVAKIYGQICSKPRVRLFDGGIWIGNDAAGINIKWEYLLYEAYQYLIQKGYAVPLFIEPNHPLNGKTAIELGLAIDKTKI